MKPWATRLILLAIPALFILPLALAWMMYTGAVSLGPQNTHNLGRLVIPAVPLDWAGAVHAEMPSGQPGLGGFWVVLYSLPAPCGKPCLDLATGLRQVHVASGQNAFRIKIALLLQPAHRETLPRELKNIYAGFHLISSPSPDFSNAIQQADSNSGKTSGRSNVYLVDPDGNIMMSYNGGDSPSKLIKDLDRLLTWSKQDKRT